MNTLKRLGCLCAAFAGLAVASNASAGSVSTYIAYPTLNLTETTSVWATTGTVFTTRVWGVGPASGGATVINHGGGTGGGGGWGVPFDSGSVGSTLSGPDRTVILYRYVSTSGPGAYITARIEGSW